MSRPLRDTATDAASGRDNVGDAAALAARVGQGAAALMRAHIHHAEPLLDLGAGDLAGDGDIASLIRCNALG